MFKTKTAKGPILWYMQLLGFEGWASLWNTIYIKPGFEGYLALERHEACHLRQMQRDGRLRYMVKYLWWLTWYGYRDNPYEVEARSCE
jgi:hypothetical protein